ncbi:MAG: zinc ABC transporter ATP-binding protein ZnuC [Alphaproteobacteria bacterium]|nr:zinc ABC transporter ATP-binding protein ZnuC [Alphaproteobacteria bacterium]
MKADADPLINATGIAMSFGRRQILSGVDLAVRAGEIVALIGPNGSGKSTLARILLGVLKPDAGIVTRQAALRLGYVPQRLPLDTVLPITVGRLMSLTNRVDAGRMAEALAEVGAAGLAEATVPELSGGELQRVLIARALLRDPDLLVLDEPTANVDFNGQIALYELIHGIRDRRGCGVLTISHDLHLVMSATDRVICLNAHICCEGRPEAVSRHPAYVALFGARAAENLAVYTHDHDHDHTLHGEVVPAPPQHDSHDDPAAQTKEKTPQP